MYRYLLFQIPYWFFPIQLSLVYHFICQFTVLLLLLLYDGFSLLLRRLAITYVQLRSLRARSCVYSSTCYIGYISGLSGLGPCDSSAAMVVRSFSRS